METKKVDIEAIDSFLLAHAGKKYIRSEKAGERAEEMRKFYEDGVYARKEFIKLASRVNESFENYENGICSNWINQGQTVPGYFWIELKRKGFKECKSSISLVAILEENSLIIKVLVEAKDTNCVEKDYDTHNKLIYLENDNSTLYYLAIYKDGHTEKSTNSREEIVRRYEAGEIKKVQILMDISGPYNNELADEIILQIQDAVRKLEPYYNVIIDSEGEDNSAMNNNIKTENENIKDKNVILYGPPGTGKTFNVVNKALEIINPIKYDEMIQTEASRDEIVNEFNRLLDIGQITFCTFHQSYSYEDFVEGLRSDEEGKFVPKDGVFKQICNSALIKNENSFSKYDFDENKINFHKMSLGDTNSGDDSIFEYCIKNNCVALGWGGDIDYSNCKSQEDIRKAFLEVETNAKSNDFNISAINRFINWIKKDDVIIISYGNYKARAIAKVTGDYYYDPKSEIGYSHFIKVQWLYKSEGIEVNRILIKKCFSQQSIYEFAKVDLNIDSIKELISSKEISNDEKKYVLIIDEINRGNISKIFGELITLIEDDKRIGSTNELKVTLPYSNEKFGVPSNLYIIGTMNTADRSIALLDTAIRRRFEFIEYMPNSELLPEAVEGINLQMFLKTINDRIEFLFDRDHTIGHAFFINDDLTFKDIVDIMKKKVIPLLQEYFYGDFEKIELILGGAGNNGDINYFLTKEKINPNKLFNKKNISNEYPSQFKYTVVENPSIDAFLNLYSNNEIED